MLDFKKAVEDRKGQKVREDFNYMEFTDEGNVIENKRNLKTFKKQLGKFLSKVTK